MSRTGITFVGAIALVAVASVGFADKERCKVKLGDSKDYHFLDSTYTRAKCELEAKKYAASRICESPNQRFDIRYRFDGVPHDVTGHCNLYMSGGAGSASSASSPSHGRERCKVKEGDDYHFLDRTYTKGSCEAQAKKYLATRLCEPGVRRYEVQYLFDDMVYQDTGYCAN